jgi:hypothetical protein
VPGERTREVTLAPGASTDTPVRNQGPGRSLPDRTRAIPCKVRAVTAEVSMIRNMRGMILAIRGMSDRVQGGSAPNSLDRRSDLRSGERARRVPDGVVAREIPRPLADNTAGIAAWLHAREPSRGGDLTRKRSLVCPRTALRELRQPVPVRHQFQLCRPTTFLIRNFRARPCGSCSVTSASLRYDGGKSGEVAVPAMLSSGPGAEVRLTDTGIELPSGSTQSAVPR